MGFDNLVEQAHFELLRNVRKHSANQRHAAKLKQNFPVSFITDYWTCAFIRKFLIFKHRHICFEKKTFCFLTRVSEVSCATYAKRG